MYLNSNTITISMSCVVHKSSLIKYTSFFLNTFTIFCIIFILSLISLPSWISISSIPLSQSINYLSFVNIKNSLSTRISNSSTIHYIVIPNSTINDTLSSLIFSFSVFFSIHPLAFINITIFMMSSKSLLISSNPITLIVFKWILWIILCSLSSF
jgi:hypothetical protein